MAREGTLFMFLILEEKLLTLHLQVWFFPVDLISLTSIELGYIPGLSNLLRDFFSRKGTEFCQIVFCIQCVNYIFLLYLVNVTFICCNIQNNLIYDTTKNNKIKYLRISLGRWILEDSGWGLVEAKSSWDPTSKNKPGIMALAIISATQKVEIGR
jgi:hypothetical protein